MQKKKFFLLFAISMMASVLLHAGCAETPSDLSAAKDLVPSENIVTQKKDVGRFDAISVRMGIKVTCRQAEPVGNVTVRVPDNLAPYLVMETNSSGKLEITFKLPKNTNIRGNCNTEIEVACGDLRSIETSSAGRFVVSGTLACDGALSLKGSSAGSISLNRLACGHLSVDLSSAARCTIEDGQVEDVEASVNSAATWEVGGLDCASLECNANSAANVNCRELVCRGKAEVEANSAAKVVLRGQCEGNVFIKANSSAKVNADRFTATNVDAEANSGASVTCYASGVLNGRYGSGGKVGYTGRPDKVVREGKGVYRLKD